MSEEEIKKTLDEAKILEKLDHPNIIRFIESYVVNGHKKSLCIVMDFADGIFKFILVIVSFSKFLHCLNAS